MIKIISIITILILSGFYSLQFVETNESKIQLEDKINFEELDIESAVSYLDNINISQKNLDLDQEYVQYKIIFHNDTSIDLNYYIRSRTKDFKKYLYVLLLTDGSDGVIQRKIGDSYVKRPIHSYGFIPAGGLLDITWNKFQFRMGKLLLNFLPIGIEDGVENTIEVQNGTEWYLTMGVYQKNTDEEKFYVSLESTKECMEIQEIDSGTEIEFLSNYYGDFDGKYFGLKIFRHGFSIAKDLEKSITTKKGSFIIFSSAGHLIGKMVVTDPNNLQLHYNSKGSMVFSYIGNKTGTWKFITSGTGIFLKHSVYLVYMDLDPHFYDIRSIKDMSI